MLNHAQLSIPIREKVLHSSASSFLEISFGSIFLAFASQGSIELPFTPIPITLQTFGVFILAMGLGSKKAPLAILGYLIQASLGFPVLAGGQINPLWILTPSAGFLLSFPLSAFVIGSILERKSNLTFLRTLFALVLGQVVIFLSGNLWLAFFVGISNAFLFGVLPFIMGAVVKILAAAISLKPMKWLKSLLTL